MRLTTRLMQLASWLLLHRAVKEGEMSLAQANKEKNKVKLAPPTTHDPNNMSNCCPIALRDLIERSLKLQGIVRRLDTTIHTHRVASIRPRPVNPVERQIGLLKAAFGAESIKAAVHQLRSIQKPPHERGFFVAPARALGCLTSSRRLLVIALRKPENFFWKRDRRPPRSSSCCWPPVQAGCDFGSMSRCMTSPSLPQVERVVNSLPSVITILIV